MNQERQEGQHHGLQIGEMPTPRYMPQVGEIAEGRPIKLIGMSAYDIHGKIRDFIWWRNFPLGDLNDEDVRDQAAALVARFKAGLGVDIAIGPPVDLSGNRRRRSNVQTSNNKGLNGVYVEPGERNVISTRLFVRGLRSEDELRQARPGDFALTLRKARAVLPRPEQYQSSWKWI